MKIMNNKTQKKTSSKKLKYGTSAVIFTVVFVVFIILANVLLSYIDRTSGGLYVDMTSKQLYGVGEETVKALSEIEKPVEIIFCAPRDRIVAEDILNPISMLAENYEKTFPGVSVIYKDKLSDVSYFDKFVKTSNDVISSYSIVVNCPSTGLSKIYSWEDMYKYNTDGEFFAFNGEYKLTSAILDLARNDDNMLLAGLVTGHGENTGHEIRHFLEDFGYDVSLVDLKTTSAEDLAKYNILLVCSPAVDFVGMEKTEIEAEKTEEEQKENADDTNKDAVEEGVEEPVEEAPAQEQGGLQIEGKSVNEIKLLRDYVTEHFGNLFIFLDPNGSNMPELFSLIEDGFGVRVSNFYPVIDYGTILNTTSYSADDWRFFGSYSTDSESAGYKMHENISASGVSSLPVFGISCLMDIPKNVVGNMEISPVVISSDEALVMAGGEMLSVPGVPLMTLSKYSKMIDSKEKTGNAVVCASGAFIGGLENPSYANADLLGNMFAKMGNSNAALDIDFKVLDESNIEVTAKDAENMRNRLAIIIPVVIAIIGTVVFIKRKYM